MKYLFDTMVVSEPGQTRPDARAAAWISSIAPSQVYLSVMTLAEIASGILRLQPSARRTRLEAWMKAEVLSGNVGRILPIDVAVAQALAILRARAARTPPLIDSLIAATALAHDLVVATRNVRDFTALGVKVVDPWA